MIGSAAKFWPRARRAKFLSIPLVVASAAMLLGAVPSGLARTVARNDSVTLAPMRGTFPPAGFAIVNERTGEEEEEGWNTFDEVGDNVTSVNDWLRIRYYDGLDGGSGPATISGDPETVEATEYWVRFRMRVSNDFYGHPTGFNKVIFFTIAGANSLYMALRGAGTDDLFFSMHTQGVQTQGGGVNYISEAECVRGETYTVDLHVVANTPGNADGRIELVVDGVPQALDIEGVGPSDADDIKFANGTVLVENSRIGLVWGGAGSEVGQTGPPAIPADFYIETDYFAIATPSFPPTDFTLSNARTGDETEDGWDTYGESGNNVTSVSDWLRIRYYSGLTGGSAAATIVPDPETVSAPEYWVRTQMRLSSDFYGHSGGIDKMVWFAINGSYRLSMSVRGTGSNAKYFALHTSGVISQSGGGNYDTGTECVRGQTYIVDIHVVANSSGNADGLIELYINGVKQSLNLEGVGATDADDIQFANGTVEVETAVLSPTWGGSGSTIGSGGVPADFYVETRYFAIAIPEEESPSPRPIASALRASHDGAALRTGSHALLSAGSIGLPSARAMKKHTLFDWRASELATW